MKNTNSVVMAFTVEQAERLTGVSKNQLIAWHRKEFFVPSFADENTRLKFSRIYNFRDLACLRVLNVLRNESRVSMRELERTKDNLSHLGEDLWATTTLYVLNRRVVFDNPETNNREEVNSGQGVFNLPLKVVTGELRKEVDEMRKRGSEQIGRVEKQHGIANSSPTIAGTRVRVEVIKQFAEAGYTIDQILKEYPSLEEKDIEAALSYKGAA